MLIDQLTDELNKTEAEHVRWMTMALTSRPKREPLPVSDIADMFLLHEDNLPWDKNTFYRFSQDMLIVIVRGVEKAHGIGV
jgi:hypothetical protein